MSSDSNSVSAVVLVIQARMNSSRLPGKILRPLAGKPLLLFLSDRLRESLNWPVIVATTDTPLDEPTVQLCRESGLPVFRGDERDVFSRFQMVARGTGAEVIVRLTGDNPLVDVEIIQSCVASHAATQADLTSTREILPDRNVKRYAPKGQSVDVLSTRALLSLDSADLDDFEREHVIPVFFRPDAGFRLNILRDVRTDGVNCSVDTVEDFEFVSRLIAQGRI